MDEQILLLQQEYGFTVVGAEEVGGRTILTTNTGLYYLYTCPAAYRYKTTFVEKVRKHVVSKTDFGVLPFIRTLRGTSFVIDGDELLYVQRAIREAAVADMPFTTGQALADFHAATGNFAGGTLYYPYRSLGSWPGMWRKRLQRYEDLRDRFDGETVVVSEFDEYLLTTFTYVHQLGEVAIKYLKDACYDRMIKVTEPFGKIAFQNFDYGYLLFDEDGSRHIAGQLNWVIDMRTRDLGQWIKAEVRRNGWQPDTVVRFLEGYNTVSPLLDDEYAVIYALLLYPGRYLRAVETYSQLTAEERNAFDFFDWQAEMDQELHMMQQVLRDYPEVILKHFCVDIPRLHWLWRSPDDETLYLRNEAAFSCDDSPDSAGC